MAMGLLVIERILRDRDGIWTQIGEERNLNRLIRDMLVSSTLALACYGAVLGAFSDFALLQAPISAVKLPLLFLVTLAICLPTLYLFNLVFGARLQVKQALALVMVAITVISMLAFAFAPISLFFLITANQYSFYKLLNVVILALAAIVGLRFLTQGMAALNRHNEDRDRARLEAAKAAQEAERKAIESAENVLEKRPEDKADGKETGGLVPVDGGPAPVPAPASGGIPVPMPGPGGALVPAGAVALAPPIPNGRPAEVPAALVPGWALQSPPPPEKQASMGLLYVWILLFGFVGTQLAWTLRPFFGSPDRDFAIFRSIDGNFYVDIVRTLGNLF
jgi:cell division protein FtsB